MNFFFVEEYVVVGAFLIDLIFGDPRRYHPISLIGFLIAKGEFYLRKAGLGDRKGGVFLFISICSITFLFTLLFLNVLFWAEEFFKAGNLIAEIVLIITASFFIALRGLLKEANKINSQLEEGDIGEAKQSLKALVGRDTENLSEEKIRLAILESLSENMSDAVIAPLFYFSLGGLPLLVLYKTVNTLDSMVGYKNDRYINFGWFSAKMDDLFNYIPARITGFLIVVSSALVLGLQCGQRAFITMLRDGGKHTSPNSGIPEAAMAGALGVRMGGPNYYGGVPVQKPYIGVDLNKISSEQIEKAKTIILLGSLIFLLFFILIRRLI